MESMTGKRYLVVEILCTPFWNQVVFQFSAQKVWLASTPNGRARVIDGDKTATYLANFILRRREHEPA